MIFVSFFDVFKFDIPMFPQIAGLEIWNNFDYETGSDSCTFAGWLVVLTGLILFDFLREVHGSNRPI